jgi:hypothetical protein
MSSYSATEGGMRGPNTGGGGEQEISLCHASSKEKKRRLQVRFKPPESGLNLVTDL